MQNQEILNQEDHDQELSAIGTVLGSVYAGNSKEVSYGEAYQSVYKLCKKGLAEEIIKQLSEVSKTKFNAAFESIDKQNNPTASLVTVLKGIKESIGNVVEILLYIETNYFQGLKGEHKSIEDLLNSLLFKQLCSNPDLVNKVSQQIVKFHIQNRNQEIVEIIQLLNELDDKETFFTENFSPIYSQLMAEHYRASSRDNYQKMELKVFLVSTKEALQEERKWLTDYFLRNKGKKAIGEVMRTIFEAAVDQQKQLIYLEKSQELFEKNTFEFLNLLNEKRDETEITKYNQWFINNIKVYLNKVDKTDNAKFLAEFIRYYEKIGEALANTKEYNIRYKAIFYFEQWINDQKINLPKRLNIYAEEAIVKKIVTEDYEKNFKTLFKLLKEKDYFEKEFRRAVSLRMIYQEYDEALEQTLVKLMEEECGENWVEKINKMRDAKQETQKVTGKKEEEGGSKVKFEPIVYEDTVWIMERGKLHGEIPKTLAEISKDFTTQYETTFKGRKVEWHPLHGAVVLGITFNKCKRQFKMETGMASVLLHLQQNGNKMILAHFYANAKYNKEQINEAISLLQKHQIILLNKPLSGQAVMTLNLDYAPTSEETLDFTGRLTETILDHHEHEELRSDRKMMVEAMIVKIMKQCKVTTLPKMYEAITPQVESRGFQFNEIFVHNAFMGLINKNFIRDLEDGSYSYIAS